MSIQENGIVEPLVVNKDMTIIGGNQRFKALSKLGYETAPCIVVDMPKDKEKALNLALNKISGRWDADKLAELMIELNDIEGFDLSLTGFDTAEIESFTKGATKYSSDPDDVPEIHGTKDVITKNGDVYMLGRHRMMCGDSTKMEDVERLCGGGIG